MFTVICWCTQSYKHLSKGLQEDCKKYNYPFHLYEVDKEYNNLVNAWCNHPKIIKRGVEDFGNILFLDLECRIVKPIPAHWEAPLVSVREPEQGFWIKYNTGTVMANKKSIKWLDAWIRLIDEWKMDTQNNDVFIHWENDICDELPFNAAVTALNIKLNTVKLSYYDRNLNAEIARGLWKNEYTIIQHPTIHHWQKEKNLKECKKLFIQNYPGDFNDIIDYFNKRKPLYKTNGWIFDSENLIYAPLEYWKDHKRQWIFDKVEISAGQR